AEEEFSSGGKKYAAGTVIAEGVEAAGASSLSAMPQVKTRELRAPRVAVLHTWISTQDEGWWRLALESMGVPYDYISTQDVARMPELRAQDDVMLFPPVRGFRASSQDIVNGYPAGSPLPWKKTDLTPNLGVDETDDMRPG